MHVDAAMCNAAHKLCFVTLLACTARAVLLCMLAIHAAEPVVIVAVEAGKAESDRSLRSLLSARRSEEDLSALRCDMPYPRRTRHQSLEPLTPQESVETIRPLSSQVLMLLNIICA